MEANNARKKSTGLRLGEFGRWFIVTLLIPFAGWGWNELQKQAAKRDEKLEQLKIGHQRELEQFKIDRQLEVDQRRADSDLVIKLLPALSGDPDSTGRSVALAVLADLAQAGVMRDGLVNAVRIAIGDSEHRLNAGTASPAERSALTGIAVMQDRNALAVENAASPRSSDATRAESSAIAARDLGVKTTSVAPRQGIQLAGAVAAPRMYIQIFDAADRENAERLRAWAQKEKNWLAPGVENVATTALAHGTKAPLGSEQPAVVYFDDRDQSDAQEVATWLEKNLNVSVAARKSSSTAPLGQLEVWYPKR